MSSLIAWYYAMNQSHLTIDELEYEMKIREIPLEASRSAAERTLRSYLKEEKGKSDVRLKFVSESVVNELEVCNDKLNGIKNHLEKRPSKKAPDQLFKTRLVHILFRMQRLKDYAEKEDELNSLALIAGECVKLLNVYYSATSHLPEVRDVELAIINESLSQLRQEHQTGVVDQGDGNANGSSDERSTGDRETGPNDGGNVRDDESEKTADSEKDGLRADIRQLTAVVTQLLQRITVLEAAQPVSQPRDIPGGNTNSTRIEGNGEKEKEVEEVHENPVDFLDWLKQRNESIDTLKNSDEGKSGDNKKKTEGQTENRTMNSGNRFPIHKWSVKYDGVDNGRRLNEFLKEVEFNARSEGFSEAELLQGAHHLFTQKARSWYMEVSCEIGSWKELVSELKKEFLPVDIDYIYERQANNRKQGPREKFQDFYLDMVRIFRNLSTPWDEKRKFDVLFRNTREDCRIAMLAANVSSIPKMRDFGKRFDSINWQTYQKKENRFSRKEVVQVEEVRDQQSFRGSQDRFKNRDQDRGGQNGKEQFRQNSQQFQNRPWKQQQSNNQKSNDTPKEWNKPKPKPDNTQRQNNSVPITSGTNALERIVKAYSPPGKNVCFNCHESGHDFEDCAKERKLFCLRCGFPGFKTKNCPHCESKNLLKTA